MADEKGSMNHPWARYEPTAEAPWNLRRVVHLHRRAGFAASWTEIQRDLADGPDASIARLLDGKARPPGSPEPEEFERIATILGEAAVASSDIGRLRAWWFYRMLFTPDPLGERLTLMWHNHFATSNVKVNDPTAMRRQNETFRRLARGHFGKILESAVRDPALLIWLDAPANRKGHPNENLGRELLELFSLGVGHYSENDVKETARALTGWTVVDDAFREAPSRHDSEAKTILGKKGNWRGSDVVRILLENPATADRLAWRVCDQFMGEGAVDKAALGELADGLRSNHLDVGWAVSTVIRSRSFFAEPNLGTRVQGPVEFITGAARALELLDPPPSTLVLADWSARLGQDLFNPPNVGGWQGGRNWLSARSLIGRANFAAALVEGRGVGRDAPLDPVALANRHGRRRDRAETIEFFSDLLLGGRPDARWVEQVAPKTDWNEDAARRAVARLLATPEAQLG
jgi:uncharacterized protein (DUF1800 family)